MDLSTAAWRKSSYSSDNGGQCVEVATNLPHAIAVRDSKFPAGSKLVFRPTEWRHFIGEIKKGMFNAMS